jgi:lactose/L-arabinose transport system substrate-binding protein
MKRFSILVISVTALLAFGALATFGDDAVTLTFWGWPYTISVIQANMDAFREAYPNIEVTLVEMTVGDLYQNLLLAHQAGQGAPDVVILETKNIGQYVDIGALVDITDHVAPFVADFDPSKWPPMERDGRYFGIPVDSGPVAMFYRTDLFQQAGLPTDAAEVAAALKTWDDYYDAAAAIKAATGAKMLAYADYNYDERFLETLLQQRGISYVDFDDNITINCPEAVDTLEYVGRLVADGYTQNAPSWFDEWYAGIAEGEVATVVSAVWFGGFLRSWIAPDLEGLWRVADLPAWEVGGVRTSNSGGSNYAISAQCPQKDAAWTFIEFMSLRTESLINKLQAMDEFPSLLTVYTDPFFNEGVPYFGGQTYYEFFSKLVPEIPAWRYTAHYAEFNAQLTSEVEAYLHGSKSAKEALDAVAQYITSNYPEFVLKHL